MKKYYAFYLALLTTCSFGTGTALAQLPNLEIWEIQGTDMQSPYRNMEVATSDNVVTAVGSEFFFIQTPTERSDGDSLSSDGILVYTGYASGLQIGDRVSISGVIREYNGMTEFDNSQLQITLESEGASLPALVILDSQFPTDTPKTIPDLESVEGMRVSLPSAQANGPADFNGVPVTARPQRIFREAGIPYPGVNNLPVWDGNPELFYIRHTDDFWMDLYQVSSGYQIVATGVMEEDDGRYELRPLTLSIEGNKVEQTVRDRKEREVSIGSLNSLTLFRNEDNYQTRLNKLAGYIVHQMKNPDILALQEVESLIVLQELIEAISLLEPDAKYQALILATNTGSFPINNGFLVKTTLKDPTVRLLGEGQQLSIGGRLHDRPPLLLEAQWPTDPPTPIKVLNLHIRSLRGIEGGDAFFVRTKRHEQAVSIARIIQSLQNKNLIVLGDMNAYEFSDGYVDVLSQISGQTSLGSEFPNNPIVNPPLLHHSAMVEPEERYSYIFNGNCQLLDHCLSTTLEDITISGLQFARGNADNPEIFLENPNEPLRVSDHDGLVLFLELSDSLLLNPPILPASGFTLQYPNPMRADDQIRLSLGEAMSIHLRWMAMDGKLIYEEQNSNLSAGVITLSPPENLPEAYYLLRIEGKMQQHTAQILFLNE